MLQLQQLQQRLLAIHHGDFQEDAAYLLVTPDIANLLLNHAVEMQPRRIVYGVGIPLDCHRNATRHATLHARASAWFGFSLCRGVWWLHSWVVKQNGLVVDSGPPTTPALYFGIPWGWELYNLFPKRPGPTIPRHELPPVLSNAALKVTQPLSG